MNELQPNEPRPFPHQIRPPDPTEPLDPQHLDELGGPVPPVPAPSPATHPALLFPTAPRVI